MSVHVQDVEKVGGAVGYNLRNFDSRVVSTDRDIDLTDATYADVRAEKDIYGKLENVGVLMNAIENPIEFYGNLEGSASLYDVVLRGTPADRKFDLAVGVFKQMLKERKRATTEDVLTVQSWIMEGEKEKYAFS